MADPTTRAPDRPELAARRARPPKATWLAGWTALALALATPGIARAEECRTVAALAASAPEAAVAPLTPGLWAEIVVTFKRHGFDIRGLETVALRHGWPVARDLLRDALVEVPFARQAIETVEWAARHHEEIAAFVRAVAETAALLAQRAAQALPALPSIQEVAAAAGRAVTPPRWVQDRVPAAAADWGRSLGGLVPQFGLRDLLPW